MSTDRKRVEKNLGTLYLERLAKESEEEGELEHWQGLCSRLTFMIKEWLVEQGISAKIFVLKPKVGDLSYLYQSAEEIAVVGQFPWVFHEVVTVGGVVHDPWFPRLVLPMKDYLLRAFPKQKVVVEKRCRHVEG